jgi:hypothetical protein
LRRLRLDRQPADEIIGDPAFHRAIAKHRQQAGFAPRQHQIIGHAGRWHDTIALAIFRAQAHSRRHAIGG